METYVTDKGLVLNTYYLKSSYNETTQQKKRQQPDREAKDRDQHFTMEIQGTTMSPHVNFSFTSVSINAN